VIDRRSRQLAGIFPGTSVTVLDRDFRYVLAAGQAFVKKSSIGESPVGLRAPDVLAPNVWAALEPHCEAALRGETRQLNLPVRSEGVMLRTRIVPWWDGDAVARIMVLAKGMTSSVLDG
jgi:hypothetical protein